MNAFKSPPAQTLKQKHRAILAHPGLGPSGCWRLLSACPRFSNQNRCAWQLSGYIVHHSESLLLRTVIYVSFQLFRMPANAAMAKLSQEQSKRWLWLRLFQPHHPKVSDLKAVSRAHRPPKLSFPHWTPFQLLSSFLIPEPVLRVLCSMPPFCTTCLLPDLANCLPYVKVCSH